MDKSKQQLEPGASLEELKLKVRPDLLRAFRRCTWIITHETGRPQLEIIQEMIEDFLIKHGC